MLKFLAVCVILCVEIHKISGEFIITKSNETYILHLQHVKWSEARQICQEEGGDLAVITSNAEENAILRMMSVYKIADAWLGVKGSNNNWVTVSGKPLNETGWTRWRFAPEQSGCALLEGFGRGMFTDGCETYMHKFVCKKPIRK